MIFKFNIIKNTKLNKQGFSHVELLFAGIIVAVVAFVGVSVYHQESKSSKAIADSTSQVYRWGGLVAGSGGASNGYPVEESSPTPAGNLKDILS